MFRLLLIIICISPLLLSAQERQRVNPNGYNTFYYPNESIASQGYLKNGKPDGYWKTFHENGTLKSEGNRRNLLLDSIWSFYNEAGMLISTLNYTDGLKTGTHKSFHASTGLPLTAIPYKNDLQHGTAFFYDSISAGNADSTFLKRTIPFDNGLEDGYGFEYNPEGLIIKVTKFSNGSIRFSEEINRRDSLGRKQGTWKQFYQNGKTKQFARYIDDELVNKPINYTLEGSVVETSTLKNVAFTKQKEESVPLKTKSNYYPNGELKNVGAYKNGIPEGLHKNYSPDGNKITTLQYANGIILGKGSVDTAGKKIGKWEIFHADGSIKGKGAYTNDRRTGDWTFFHLNGSISQEGTFDTRGRPTNKWVWYFPALNKNKKGTVQRFEHYRRGRLDGEMAQYTESGDTVTQGLYINNKKDGNWILQFYDYKQEGAYANGKRVGLWTHYDRLTGKIKFQGEYINDRPEGEHTYYHSTGKRAQQGSYTAGVKDGKWKYYTKDNVLFLTIHFENGREVAFDRTNLYLN